MELSTITFIAPSGNEFTIREQNGEDEDILSNPKEMRSMLHLSRFIAAIVTNTTFTSNGKMTLKDALNLPLLDRYCILFKSRIFSIGSEIEFEYTWPNNSTVPYVEDLERYVFDDYGKKPSEEELDSKPNAIPFYPDPSIILGKDFTLSSGKIISFKAATAESEQMFLNMPEDKRTRNAELVARHLKLEVNGEKEVVHNFSLFSVKDMTEIRRLVNTYDPTFMGMTDLEDPDTGNSIQYPVLAIPSFFFPSEL